jgi:hypothetical protein
VAEHNSGAVRERKNVARGVVLENFFGYELAAGCVVNSASIQFLKRTSQDKDVALLEYQTVIHYSIHKPAESLAATNTAYTKALWSNWFCKNFSAFTYGGPQQLSLSRLELEDFV